jgi:hypothetical protein
MLDQIAELMETRQGKSLNDMVKEALVFGLDNKVYRSRRNKRIYQETKFLQTVKEQLERENAALKAKLAAEK